MIMVRNDNITEYHNRRGFITYLHELEFRAPAPYAATMSETREA